ncbi:MAG: hypothetical protein ACREIV_12230, partial [Planctomycetaceae bacterium]
NDPAALQAVPNVFPAQAGLDAVTYVLDTPAGKSNPVLIYLTDEPVALEQEPNDSPDKSQTLAVPGEVAAQFSQRGDVDVFAFEAKAGEVYYIEVYGHRIASDADPYFVLDQITKSAEGVEITKRITTQDDGNTNLAQNVFDTRTDDPVFRFQAPADGTCRLTVHDRYHESRGNAGLLYRLSVRKEDPDFRLVILPTQPVQNGGQGQGSWAIGLRKGDNFAARVFAFRRDGFNGTIDLWADGLPQGVACPGASIGPDADSADLIFTAAADAPQWAGAIKVFGKARVEDPQMARAVQSAEAALKTAREPIAKLEETARKAQEPLKQEQEAFAKAQEVSAQKPDDANLKSQMDAAQKKVEAATAAARQAEDALAAARQKVAETEAALQKSQAEHAAAIREVTREVRG